MALSDFLLGGAALADVPLAGQEEAAIAAVFPPVVTGDITAHTLEQHAKTLASYLPTGEAFEAALIAGTNANMLMLGLAGELLRLESFLVVYNSEFIPLNTNVFIEEWERVLGIPDGVFPGPSESDRDTRRLHILVKLASLGVTTVADFEAIPVILGLINVTVQPGIDAGFLPTADARFTIVIDFSENADKFPLSFPISFGNTANTIARDLFLTLKPANCQIQFL